MEQKEEQDHHWYAATGDTWVAKLDIYDALETLRKHTGIKEAYYLLIRVPLPISATYKISGYVPQVPNAEVVAEGRFKLEES
jgi:hypothetical protein